MVQKRLRVFAGPNGSGKTTIINELKNKKNNEKINLGVYVNADDIELEFRTQNLLNLSNYKIKLTLIEIQNYFRNHAFSPNKLKSEDFWNTMLVSQNCIYLHKDQSINSYIAADFAALIREKLLSNNISFSFETVLSHISKLEFMEKAKNLGYKVYLYFISTIDPEININRVSIRVSENGHNVPTDTIRRRYYQSLGHLKAAVKLSNRAYIFDNSNQVSLLIAEITNGKDVLVFDNQNTPNWFTEYLYE